MPSSALISEGRLNRGHFWTWTIFPLLQGFWQAKMDTPKMNNIWKLTKHKWFKQGVSNLFQFAFQAPSKKTASNDRRLTWNKVLPLEKGSSTHKRLPPKRQTGANSRQKAYKSGQITIIPKVEFRRFGGDSLMSDCHTTVGVVNFPLLFTTIWENSCGWGRNKTLTEWFHCSQMQWTHNQRTRCTLEGQVDIMIIPIDLL